MTPHYADDKVTLYGIDCRNALPELADNSVDAVVTDPPYGLEFMGKEWDKFDRKGPASFENLGQDWSWTGGSGKPTTGDRPYVNKPRFSTMGSKAMRAFQDWCEQWAAECLRVLKPGGHLLAFGGTRTWHRLACAVEDAGFEVRDSIAWLYGSGFPKSLDVSKAIDKAAGAEREITRIGTRHGSAEFDPAASTARERRDAPATADAARWQGWGTALKPAFEPVVCARKPLAGTVAATVLAHGTGALNIDGCRIEGDVPTTTRGGNQFGVINDDGWQPSQTGQRIEPHTAGRWPANVVLDESQADALDQMSGERPGFSSQRDLTRRDSVTEGWGNIGKLEPGVREGFNDQGGASRFFYTAKANSNERVRIDGIAHPTVKPLDLMRWLVRLVTPPGGTVLEPFAGSGTTVEACILEGFQCIAIEREADYLPLILDRIKHPQLSPMLAAGRSTSKKAKAADLDGGLLEGLL